MGPRDKHFTSRPEAGQALGTARVRSPAREAPRHLSRQRHPSGAGAGQINRIGALILAAGQAQRFGGAKLMAPFRGKPVLAHVVDVVRDAQAANLIADAWAVVPGEDSQLRSLVQQSGLIPVPNDNPGLGISHSLRLGLAALATSCGGCLGAAIVLLGDQPLVRLDAVGALIQGWRDGRGPVLRPRYASTPEVPGHPVLLERSTWSLVERISGDRGLGALLRPGEPGVGVLELPGGNPDIDTAGDLLTLEGPNP
ncbi:MAG TPA: nucleotidyltransferase family protein [Gemmatimonadales bacterium]